MTQRDHLPHYLPMGPRDMPRAAAFHPVHADESGQQPQIDLQAGTPLPVEDISQDTGPDPSSLSQEADHMDHWLDRQTNGDPANPATAWQRAYAGPANLYPKGSKVEAWPLPHMVRPADAPQLPSANIGKTVRPCPGGDDGMNARVTRDAAWDDWQEAEDGGFCAYCGQSRATRQREKLLAAATGICIGASLSALISLVAMLWQRI